jgi:molybdopterin synthase sulfur carrier subunit
MNLPRQRPTRGPEATLRRAAATMKRRRASRKHVQVQYFAMLREQAGCDEEKIETGARSLAALYEELRARHGFTVPVRRLKVAVNDDFVAWDSLLAAGARVAFIPPFAGG